MMFVVVVGGRWWESFVCFSFLIAGLFFFVFKIYFFVIFLWLFLFFGILFFFAFSCGAIIRTLFEVGWSPVSRIIFLL